MADDDKPKRYLVTVQLRPGPEGRRQDILLIIEWMRSFAKSEHEVAFRSSDGFLFGFYIKTGAPQFMSNEFEKCRGTIDGDAMLLVEVGKLVDAVGFGRAATWLQRH